MTVFSKLLTTAFLFSGVFFSTPALAQGGDRVGACMLETSQGEPINIGGCRILYSGCNNGACHTSYLWLVDQFVTELSGGETAELRDSVFMNGQPTQVPAALIASDPRQCVYNTVTDGLFCFVEGVEALAFASNTSEARSALIEIAAGGEVLDTPVGKKKSVDAGDTGIDPFLVNLQGKYRPSPSWDCGEIGSDGGATAIIGNTLEGLETACELSSGQAVGSIGAAMFQANCSGEGETWQDEYILHRDNFGSLAVIRTDSISVWQACE